MPRPEQAPAGREGTRWISSGDNGAVKVTFRLPADSGADRAWVVGEFNNWSTDSHPMTRRDDGSLDAVIELVPGTYRFRYYLGERTLGERLGRRHLRRERVRRF